MLYPIKTPWVIDELSVPFHVNLFPVIIAPSRLLLVGRGTSSPACNKKPLEFTDVMELFNKEKVVGAVLGIFIPSQLPVSVLFTTIPSLFNIIWADNSDEITVKDIKINTFFIKSSF